MQVNKGTLTDSDISDWINLPATKVFFESLEKEKEELQFSALSYFVEGDMEKTFSSLAEVSGAVKNLIWVFDAANSGRIFKEEKVDPRLTEVELNDTDY